MEPINPMTAQFNALDKDSGAGYSKSVVFHNKVQLRSAWREFKQSVPFSRWYPDNVFSNTDNEHHYDCDSYKKIIEEELD